MKAVKEGMLHLDKGERMLWAHALGRSDAWAMCGPDKSSLYAGVRLGFKERLISLERLFDDIGYRPKTRLRLHFTSRWLRQKINLLVGADPFVSP